MYIWVFFLCIVLFYFMLITEQLVSRCMSHSIRQHPDEPSKTILIDFHYKLPSATPKVAHS